MEVNINVAVWKSNLCDLICLDTQEIGRLCNFKNRMAIINTTIKIGCVIQCALMPLQLLMAVDIHCMKAVRKSGKSIKFIFLNIS